MTEAPIDSPAFTAPGASQEVLTLPVTLQRHGSASLHGSPPMLWQRWMVEFHAIDEAGRGVFLFDELTLPATAAR